MYLESGGDDGWFIAQVITQAKYQDQNGYLPLTSDLVFNKWLDGDRDHYDQVWYNAKHLPLNLSDRCFSDFQISGTTSDSVNAGIDSSRFHYIVFHLIDGEERVKINGIGLNRNTPFTKEIPTERCIKLTDIKQISLDAESTDGWRISDITTSYYDSSSSSFVALTVDSFLDRFLDGNRDLNYDATHLVLSLVG